MRIRSQELKKRITELEMPVDALAAHIERDGLKGDRAQKAVRNWRDGRDHPRCKAVDIRKLAEALNCEPKDLARFTSQIRNHRGSTQKARLVADMIRGKSVDEALNSLAFSPKRAATNVKKALSAAIADAELADADVTNLVVAESRVDEAPVIKRFRPKDRGRAHPIHKQQSHITIGVQERGGDR